jgi:hypothetical protein
VSQVPWNHPSTVTAGIHNLSIEVKQQNKNV